MACTLIDDAFDQKEKNFLPLEPICYPIETEKKITLFNTVYTALIAVILSIPFITIVILNYHEWYNNPKVGVIGGIIHYAQFFILGYICIYFIGLKLYKAMLFKMLQDPRRNPEGCAYQGKVLSYEHIHVIQHIEYYRSHGTWTIPDGTDLNLYIPENIEAYIETLRSKPIKDIYPTDLHSKISIKKKTDTTLKDY